MAAAIRMLLVGVACCLGSDAFAASLWVDNTPGSGNTQFTATGGSQPASVTGLVLGTNLFTTIQAAVNAAAPSDTINVSNGVYAELVSVTKSVTLRGNKFGLDARSRPLANETEVIGAASGGTRSGA